VFRRSFTVLTLSIGVTILTAPLARSQSGGAAPRFEVSSIRHCAPGGPSGVPPPAPGRISVNCISVMTLIGQSYILFANGTMNLLPAKVVSLEKSTGWINSDLYTIEAKAEAKPGQALPGQGMMLGPMMQALLEDRFGVKVHREVRQVPVYELTVGKGGPRLHSAAEGGCVAQNLDPPLPPPAAGQVPRIFCGRPLITNTGFELRAATMEQLCTALSGRVDRRVIDKTGVAGIFDIRLDWSNGDLPSGPAPPPPPPRPDVFPATGPDPGEVTAGIRAALQNFGLNLEPAQGPGDFLVIDHVERPSEN
jgi:uncharacterized protein (TIGR03435 family)